MEIFHNAKPPYKEALKKCGYTLPFTYIPPIQSGNRNNSSRKRKITLFNPPFNSNVSTYVTRTFLKLIDKHFARSQKLNKIFNRKTIKISYSSMEKLKKIIKEHNKKFTINNTKIQQDCNWRIKERCSIIYECTACTKYNPEKAYLWLTKKELKKGRRYNHARSFKHQLSSSSTTLSNYFGVWKRHKRKYQFDVRNNKISSEIFKHNETIPIMSMRETFNCYIPKPIKTMK